MKLFFFAVLLLLSTTQRVFAISYFVDSSAGSDSNNGTSASSAWRSLSRINSQLLNPGDSVAFKRGGAWVGSIETTRSGSSGNPIVFTAYGSGPAPVLSNPCSACYSNIFVIRSSWIVIRDLLMRDTHHAAVIMRAGSSNVTVSDNEIVNTGIGIFLQTSNHIITRNNIHDLNMVVNNTSHPDDDYGANGIWLEKSDNNEISYNTCKNCRAPSYDYGYDGGFVEFWTGNNNNRIHHNWVENTLGVLEIGGNDPSGSVSNNTISYNVLYNNLGFGCLHTDGNFRTPIENLRIENNTIVNLNVEGYRMLDCMVPTPDMLIFRNNIVISPIQIASSGNFTRSNNLYFMQNGAPIGYSLNASEKTGNPLFLNIDGKDFRLQSGSPAKDAGANLGYSFDFENKSVPSGDSPDIGAYESGGSVSNPTSTPTSNPVVTATPRPTSIPSPTGSPAPGSTEIKLYVAGRSAGGVYPTMELRINNSVVASWSNIQGDYTNRVFQTYTYLHPTSVNGASVKVYFTNDTIVGSEDSNLYIDKILVNSVPFETESSTVFSEGSYSVSNGCGSGYKQSETLHCNGYFQYDLSAYPSGTPVSTKSGDGNGDGKVNGLDYIVWLNNFGSNTAGGVTSGDYNLDGKVNGLDYIVWIRNFNL